LDTTPGIHAPHAKGIPVAIVSEYAGGGDFFVSSHGSKRMRRVSGNLLPGRLAGSAPYTDRGFVIYLRCEVRREHEHRIEVCTAIV
jgi:hypothetical protein